MFKLICRIIWIGVLVSGISVECKHGMYTVLQCFELKLRVAVGTTGFRQPGLA